MDSQGRSRFIIGGLTLAAVILVISLLLTQQSRRLPSAIESPLSDGATVTVVAPENIETAADSPLASPLSESPLASPGSAASVSLPVTRTTSPTETVIVTNSTVAEAITDSVAMTESVPMSAPISSPVAITSTSTVTVSVGALQPLLYGFEVVATYPHDPGAYTQGLQYVDGVLYEGTGLYGRSTLRRVDLETGVVEQQIELDDPYFGEGIYVLENRIFQITWQSNIAFLYDRETFAQIGQFSYPTEGWGLTYDGEDLLMSDGSSTIFRRDPQTFDEVGRIDVQLDDEPVNMLNELEYINNAIWANIWLTDDIVMIDPTSGQVIARAELTGLLPEEDAANAEVLNGIAYDEENDRIFVTGKFWPSLFEIKLVPR